ncbi:MAG: MFS transporter [Chloroflexi bacterium]|nr:MFS transporter [Chloroflexota bacterium]
MLAWLSVDGKKLLATRVMRTFAYGYLATVLGVYLDALGMDPTQIGVVLTAAIAGSAVMTVFWSFVADRYGRRRTVATMAGLMAAGGLLFAVTNEFWLLLVGAFTGTISVTSSEVGIFQTVEQAILPQTAPNERRTWLFSIYNTVANFAGAAGSLAAASVGLFTGLGFRGVDAYRPLFVLYALIGLANLVIFLTLSDRVELAKVEGERRFLGIRRSGGTVAKLSALFGLDAFAGALVVHSFVLVLRALGRPALRARSDLLLGQHPVRGIAPRRGMAGATLRPAEHNGVHAPALERPAHARPARAQRGPGRGLLPRAHEHLADGRADAAVIHHGGGRSRRADCDRGHHECRADDRERDLTRGRRHGHERGGARVPVPPRRRSEDRVRRPHLRDVPQRPSAGGRGGPQAQARARRELEARGGEVVAGRLLEHRGLTRAGLTRTSAATDRGASDRRSSSCRRTRRRGGRPAHLAGRASRA